MEMSFSGSSDSRCSSWATIRLAIWSSTGVPRKMIRSFSRRLYMSNARSPREVCSTTMGMSGLIVLALVSLRRSDSSTRLAGRRAIGGGPQPAGLRHGRRLLLAQVLQAPGRAQLIEQPRGLDALALGRGRDGDEQLLIGDRYALGGH